MTGKTPNGSPIFFVPIHLHDPNKTELGAWLKSLLRTMDIFFVKHDAWHIGVTLVIDCSKVGRGFPGIVPFIIPFNDD